MGLTPSPTPTTPTGGDFADSDFHEVQCLVFKKHVTLLQVSCNIVT